MSPLCRVGGVSLCPVAVVVGQLEVVYVVEGRLEFGSMCCSTACDVEYAEFLGDDVIYVDPVLAQRDGAKAAQPVVAPPKIAEDGPPCVRTPTPRAIGRWLRCCLLSDDQLNAGVLSAVEKGVILKADLGFGLETGVTPRAAGPLSAN